ncbi:MAG: capsid cement protein [Pseudomonadota bacterium]|jgi:hypothetical protein
MSNPILMKNFVAAAALEPSRIVVLSAADTAALATSATAASIGISDQIQVAAGQRIDVVVAGIADVTAGAAVAHGAPLTADAQGRAVTAAAGNRVIGVALDAAAAAGDRIRCVIAHSVF